jgi:zinc transporter ZupT
MTCLKGIPKIAATIIRCRTNTNQQKFHDDHDHGHEHHAHTLAEKSAQHLSWVGTALGMTLHSLLDGLALAAAVEAGAKGHAAFAGLGVALVVILHKPFDAMAVSALMTASGSSRFLRHLLNCLFALVSPLGAVLFYFGASHVADSNAAFLGCALAFCAGSFLCIASSDLLPELQFHSHDRFKLSIALLAGLAVAVLIKQFEAEADQPALTASISQLLLLSLSERGHYRPLPPRRNVLCKFTTGTNGGVRRGFF